MDYVHNAIAADVILALPSLIGNGFVICLYARIPTLRTKANSFILSLTVSCLLTTTIGAPSSILSYLGKPRNSAYVSLSFIHVGLCTIGSLSLLGALLERHKTAGWKVKDMFSPKNKISTKVIVTFLVIWSLAIIASQIPSIRWKGTSEEIEQYSYLKLVDRKYLLSVTVLCVYIPCALMGLLFARIHFIAWRQVRQIAAMELVGAKDQRTYYRKETQQTRGLLVLTLCFLLSWLPLCVLYDVICFCASCKILPIYVIIASTCSHFYPSVHPFLCIYALQDFRKISTKLWEKWCAKVHPEEGYELGDSDV